MIVRLAIESVPHSILQIASQSRCELIVLGTHGRSSVRRAVLGSVAERVARHGSMPVMLVPAGSKAG